jgi:20S proteasome alpha/beta subunit
MAAEFDGGVVIAADSRTTSGYVNISIYLISSYLIIKYIFLFNI